MRGRVWWWLVVVVLAVFNTVLGEKLLFRGFVLLRMSGAVERRDWIANGILFSLYHLDVPWVTLARRGCAGPRLAARRRGRGDSCRAAVRRAATGV